MRIRKSAEIRKAEIVGAALRLADKLGPDRLTMEAVAQDVGLTQPGVFRHFPKKQDLWEAVVGRIGAMMEAHWAKAGGAKAGGAKAGDRDSAPTDRVRGLVAAQLRLIQSMPAIAAILFSRELHVENESLRKAMLGFVKRFHHLLASSLTKAREAGALRADLDCDDAAFLIVGLVQGLAVRWSLSKRAFNLVDEGSRLLDLQLRGFASLPHKASVERISA